MQETLAFVDCLVNDTPAPCTGEDGLVALVMSIAAGISAEEQRWVQLSELAEEIGAGQPKAFIQTIVDDKTGAINFDMVTNPKYGLIAEKLAKKPAQVFEEIAGKVWVPPSRPDLKKKIEKMKS